MEKKNISIAQKTFIKYLKDKGSPLFSEAGNRSTALDYPSRVKRICVRENYETLDELEQHIEEVISKYSHGGEEAEYGAQSNGSNLKALELFKEFCETLDLCISRE